MTRAELLEIIARFGSKNGLFDAPEDWDKEERITEWVAQAPEGWFDVLVNILADPPDWVQYEKDNRLWLEGNWQEFIFAFLIAEGVNQDLETRLAQINPLLNRADTRLLILWVYPSTKTAPDRLFWLKPLVDQVLTLAEDEQVALVMAVLGLPTEVAKPLLLQMQEVIPVTAAEAQKYINCYLPLI